MRITFNGEYDQWKTGYQSGMKYEVNSINKQTFHSNQSEHLPATLVSAFTASATALSDAALCKSSLSKQVSAFPQTYGETRLRLEGDKCEDAAS